MHDKLKVFESFNHKALARQLGQCVSLMTTFNWGGRTNQETLSFRHTDNSTSRIVKNILNWFSFLCLRDIRQASSALCRLEENNRNSFKFWRHPCLCNQLVVVLCRIVRCGLILLTKFTECREGKIELCWGLDFLLFLERRAIDADYLCIEGKIKKTESLTICWGQREGTVYFKCYLHI